MRVAFLLHGLIGGMSGKAGKGKLIDYKFCRDRFFKNIIGPNNADVFIHSWSIDQKDELIDIYSPKKFVIEKQIQFQHGWKRQKIISRFYSSQQVIKLKREYEKENNFIYDFVMITRFDLIWHTPINFKKLDPNYFYIGKWNQVDYVKKEVTRRHFGIDDKINDLYFLSNSKFMNTFGDAFNSVLKIRPNPHKFLQWYLESKYKQHRKLMYLKCFDHDVYRDRVESYKKGKTILKENFKEVDNIIWKSKGVRA